MKKTNFYQYLAAQMQDPTFAARFEQAGEAWDVALQLAALREQAGLSQKELARKLKTSQQQISRLESTAYEGHSLSMLRRVAAALHARVRVVIEPDPARNAGALAEDAIPYRANPPLQQDSMSPKRPTEGRARVPGSVLVRFLLGNRVSPRGTPRINAAPEVSDAPRVNHACGAKAGSSANGAAKLQPRATPHTR
jgi:transcriptional regulator with XRE-family HTH domain